MVSGSSSRSGGAGTGTAPARSVGVGTSSESQSATNRSSDDTSKGGPKRVGSGSTSGNQSGGAGHLGKPPVNPLSQASPTGMRGAEARPFQSSGSRGMTVSLHGDVDRDRVDRALQDVDPAVPRILENRSAEGAEGGAMEAGQHRVDYNDEEEREDDEDASGVGERRLQAGGDGGLGLDEDGLPTQGVSFYMPRLAGRGPSFLQDEVMVDRGGALDPQRTGRGTSVPDSGHQGASAGRRMLQSKSAGKMLGAGRAAGAAGLQRVPPFASHKTGIPPLSGLPTGINARRSPRRASSAASLQAGGRAPDSARGSNNSARRSASFDGNRSQAADQSGGMGLGGGDGTAAMLTSAEGTQAVASGIGVELHMQDRDSSESEGHGQEPGIFSPGADAVAQEGRQRQTKPSRQRMAKQPGAVSAESQSHGAGSAYSEMVRTVGSEASMGTAGTGAGRGLGSSAGKEHGLVADSPGR